jgi:hypothetical protein
MQAAIANSPITCRIFIRFSAPRQPPGEFVQLLQGFVGNPHFPTFIPFVDNLGFET